MASITTTAIGDSDGDLKPVGVRCLFRQPLALQWFEGGELRKREEGERQAGRFELFLDLLYVAILANFAEDLADHVSGPQVAKYLLIITPAWHVWSDLRELMNSFYNDDLAQRTLILFVMACMVLFGNNAVLVDKDLNALRVSVCAYLVARLAGMSAHLVYSFASYHHRAQQRLWVVLSFFSLLLFLPLLVASISLRHKAIIAAVAICLEEFIWFFTYSPLAKRLLRAKYTTAVDIPHEIDRFAAFFIIVLGEFVYQIVVGSPAAVGFTPGLGHAVCTLVIAFCLNWLYVHGDGSLHSTHALRHSTVTAFIWVGVHLPMVASLLAGGHVVAETATGRDLAIGKRWLLCGGLGIGMLCMWVVAQLNECNDPRGALVLPKHFRLCTRPVVGMLISALPLVPGLSVSAMMAVIMLLLVGSVVWENVTSLLQGFDVWEPWQNTEYPTEECRQEEEGSGESTRGYGTF